MSDQPIEPADIPTDDIADYGFLDDMANREADALVRSVLVEVEAGELERVEALDRVGDGLRALGERHPEAADITVRTAVVRELAPAFVAAGWDAPEPFEF